MISSRWRGLVAAVVAVGWGSSKPPAPIITTQPASATVFLGESATFQVTAAGGGALQYAWSRNGALVAGANGASYTTPRQAITDSGASFTVAVRRQLVS
jgi:beta-galactosidase